MVTKLKFNNYVGDYFTTNFWNSKWITSGIPDRESVIGNRYSINIDKDRLIMQADVFAQHILSTSIKLVDIVGRDQRSQHRKLVETYIYSFAKAYVLGYNSTIVSDFAKEALCFGGHALLYHAMKNNMVTFDFYEGIDYHVQIQTRSSFHDDNIEKLKSFKFLDKGFRMQDVSGEEYFEVPYYESVLRKLRDYKLPNGNKRNFKSKSNGSNDENSSESNVIDVKSTFNIDIISLESDLIKANFLSSSYPIGNSHLDITGSIMYYVPMREIQVTSKDYAINRALFITYTDLKFPDFAIYAKADITMDKGRYTKYEVHSVTNLPCKINPDLKEAKEIIHDEPDSK